MAVIPVHERNVIDTIIDQELETDIVRLREVAEFSSVNRTYDVETAQGRFALRMQFDLDLSRTYLREAQGIRLSKRLGVPGPDVVAIGVLGSDSYTLHTWLEGTNGSLYKGEPTRVFKLIGEYARKINSIDARGRIGTQFITDTNLDAASSLRTWVKSNDKLIFGTDDLITANLLTTAQFEIARERLNSMKSWEFAPVLCHGDLSLRNVIVRPNETVAIIDWGNSMCHRAPHRDLVEIMLRVEDAQYLAAYCEGYGLPDDYLAANQEELHVLLLWRALSAAQWIVRWRRDLMGLPIYDLVVQVVDDLLS